MNRRWTKEEAWDWWNARPWIMGLNYVPACQPEYSYWQEDTREEALKTIIPELDLLKELGFNSVRMFLPSIMWILDGDKFLDALDAFLGLLDERGIGMMPVIGNDCVSFGRPKYLPEGHEMTREDWEKLRPVGPQPFDWGYHGGHKDSPFTGEKVIKGWIYWDEPEFRKYSEGWFHALFSRFAKDPRIHIWDLWNEPGNSNRHGMSIPYIQEAFEIARSYDPIQPLTACVWRYDPMFGIDPSIQMSEIERVCVDLSDIITFHQYSNFTEVQATVARLEREGRPMANTEWLHRIFNNNIPENLQLYYDHKIGSYHWGLTAGKCQFYLPWDDIKGRPDLDYTKWQHDIIRQDGHTPYDPAEIALFKKLGADKEGAGAALREQA